MEPVHFWVIVEEQIITVYCNILYTVAVVSVFRGCSVWADCEWVLGWAQDSLCDYSSSSWVQIYGKSWGYIRVETSTPTECAECSKQNSVPHHYFPFLYFFLFCYCSFVLFTVSFCTVASNPTCIIMSQAIWNRSSRTERKQLTSKKYVHDSSVLRKAMCFSCTVFIRNTNISLIIFIYTDNWSLQNTAVLTGFFIP